MSDLWEESVGQLPWKVTAYERAEKGGVVYLRWRAPDIKGRKNWRRKSLGRVVRTASGRLIEKSVAWAVQQAQLQYDRLVAGLPDEVRETLTPLTIRDGLALATHPTRGQYKVDTPHRRELTRSLNHAVRVWGERKTWASVTMEDLSELWCDRMDALRARGYRGQRSAVVVIRDVLAVAGWLRGTQKIPATACLFEGRYWKKQLAKDWRERSGEDREYTPDRPRHTRDELLAVLAVLPQLDPRFSLALDLGAEDRLGQVLRCRRSDLDPDDGRLQIHGLGKKRGTRVALTASQLAHVMRALTTGYLRELEDHYLRTGEDYPLFPAGQLKGNRVGLGDGTRKSRATPWAGWATVAQHGNAAPVNRSVLDGWMKDAERLAGVTHMPGRGLYGLRRQGVDGAMTENISPEGLQAWGGWADGQIPDRIYRDTKRRGAEEEARETRDRHRGTAPGERGDENART